MSEGEAGAATGRGGHGSAWIGAGAVVVAALIGVVGGFVTAQSGDDQPSGAPDAQNDHSAAEVPAEETESDSTHSSETTPSETPTEPETVYLDSLTPIGNTDLVSSSVVVNGDHYEHALVNDMETWVTCGDGANGGDTEYNLGRNFDTFHVTVGLTDTADRGSTYTFLVYGDNSDEPLGSANAKLGEPAELTVDVHDVLRLRLVQSDCGETGGVVWADPTLTRAEGEG